MNNIKYLIAVTALATALGPVVNVQAGPGQSRLAGDLLEMQREEREKAAQLQKEEREKAARLQAIDMALVKAAARRDLNGAIKAVGAGANVNNPAARNWGQTPLLLACQTHHTAMVSMLLEAKAEVNKPYDKGKWTPLLLASSCGNTEIATMLIRAKAEVNEANDQGWLPLLLAKEQNHAEIVKILVFSGAIPSGRETIEMQPIVQQAQEARKEALQAVAEQEQLKHDLKSLPGFPVAAIHTLCCDYAAPYCQDPFLQQVVDLVRIKNDQWFDDICVVQ